MHTFENSEEFSIHISNRLTGGIKPPVPKKTCMLS